MRIVVEAPTLLDTLIASAKKVRKKRHKRQKPLSVTGLLTPSVTDALKEEHFRAPLSSGPDGQG